MESIIYKYQQNYLFYTVGKKKFLIIDSVIFICYVLSTMIMGIVD